MLFEKKMLILSGDGKGVVFIEKSARGVVFSLRMFDMPECGELKAGVITRTVAVVRDIAQCGAATFTLDIDDISELHFAVFDKRLRLYGTNGKRMWEANIMELLDKNDRRSPIDDRVPDKKLPPIAHKPKVLPMPDGSGIPQTRLALYGDEALSDSDFYTSLDFSERMPSVDKFLDEPRISERLAPRVLPPVHSDAQACAETTAVDCAVETDTCDTETSTENANCDSGFAAVAAVSGNCGETLAAIDVDEIPYERPCELERRWIKNLPTRTPSENHLCVKPIQHVSEIKHVREVSFIERAQKEVDKLFSNAKKDVRLAELLPDMEWVAVETDGNRISVGRGGNVLCYAVAGDYNAQSPLGDEAQWLPDDKNVPTDKGYWLIFQSLADGEIIV